MKKLEGVLPSRAFDQTAGTHIVHSVTSLLKQAYRSHRLENLSEHEAVNALGMVLKMGGDFTFNHSARVLELAMELADEVGVHDSRTRRQVRYGALLKDIGKAGIELVGLPEESQQRIGKFLSSQDLRQAGLLHDIGKTKIPNEILYKPGKLSDEEFTIMKQHPVLGEEMVYPIHSLRHLCPAIRGHHERWDGKGYPDGLKGEEIPLAARIIAVADVFDALQAPRPYKPGMEISKVREILLAGKGTHFDPQLVDAFMRVVRRKFA